MTFETSAVRQAVAGFLSIGGQNFPCTNLTVTLTGARQADRFSATIPIDASNPEDWWASQNSLSVECIFAVAGQQKSVLSADSDEISFNWFDRSVTVTGRDKSSALTETRINKKYVNQPAAAIVSDIAQSYGLTPQVNALAGAGDVSKKFDIDTTHLILNRTPFEAISTLAEREGVPWFVKDGVLHFGDPESGGSYPIEYHAPPKSVLFLDRRSYIASNAMRLITSRNLVAAKEARVTVKSWNQKDKKLYESTATAPAAGGSGLTPNVSSFLQYEYHAPGLDQEKADKVAKNYATETIGHEMNIEIEMPGDIDLDVTMKVALSGTGTIFDQEYDINELTFEYESGENGFFSMLINSKSTREGRSSS